jgi:hypothetical protein
MVELKYVIRYNGVFKNKKYILCRLNLKQLNIQTK